MDQQPSTSRPECLSPRRKRPQTPFSATEKLMVRNVFKYVWGEKVAKCLGEYDFKMNITNECVEKTADIIGISKKTVYNILKEHKENQEFRPPAKSGPKRNFKDKLSKADFEGISRKIKQIEDANETPTIRKVLNLVLEDPTLPNFSRTTMMKIMTHIKNMQKSNCNVPVSNNNDDNDRSKEDSDAGGSTDVTEGTSFELIEVKVEYSSGEDDSS